MNRRGGFANPEPMMLIALIGIILAVTVPQIAKVVERRRNVKNLAELRAALVAYRADHKQANPVYLRELIVDGRYLKEMPVFSLAGAHTRQSADKPGPSDDAGGWNYEAWPGSPREGQVWINCTHTDRRGVAWSAY